MRYDGVLKCSNCGKPVCIAMFRDHNNFRRIFCAECWLFDFEKWDDEGAQ